MRKRQQEIWKDNSGFTLLELMIVIAISAVLLTLVTLSYSVVNNSNVNKAAHNYSSILSRGRAESMAKGTAAGQINLKMEGGVLYYWIGDPSDESFKEEVCGSMIDVEIVYSDAMLAPQPFPAGVVTIKFTTSGFVTNDGHFVSQLIFSRGNRRVATVLYSTGKNETMLL